MVLPMKAMESCNGVWFCLDNYYHQKTCPGALSATGVATLVATGWPSAFRPNFPYRVHHSPPPRSRPTARFQWLLLRWLTSPTALRCTDRECKFKHSCEPEGAIVWLRRCCMVRTYGTSHEQKCDGLADHAASPQSCERVHPQVLAPVVRHDDIAERH